ncbi:hypothetical protein [Methanoplanus endosymbiosus]|uniref:Uncharacterized protein n=1 Tax=Methanoplanus endosymbiosus TaxID=33865 RepID=A0A9E7PTH7_9EURY|nr:hypothetical protein [Methanoplanus endosymbiosus]UUX93652.1 hypothetical protein L6E24_05915 [Methanoplanus endosymbiosus]
MFSEKKCFLMVVLSFLLLNFLFIAGAGALEVGDSVQFRISGPDGSEDIVFVCAYDRQGGDSEHYFDSSGNHLMLGDSGYVYVDFEGNIYVSDDLDNKELKMLDAPPLKIDEGEGGTEGDGHNTDATGMLHGVPVIPYDALPLWEGEYKPGTGSPVIEVVNYGKETVNFSFWKSGDFYSEYYLTPADYVVNVSKGESKSIVVDEGDYLYWAGEAPYDKSGWHSGSSAWFDKDCHYKAVFPEKESSLFLFIILMIFIVLLIVIAALVIVRRKKKE